MLKILMFLILLTTLTIPLPAQGTDAELATFQETAQLFIDKKISQNVTASITLQSTSNQEMQIPSELEQKIRDNTRIKAIVLTNEERCVLGVMEQSCIMINISRNDSEKGIVAIQESSRKIGEQYIDDLNSVFDTNSRFHSVFVHHSDDTNKALDTSGDVSGKGTISVVYTMPKEDTRSMYEKISSILIPHEIRDSDGFYEVAKDLSSEKNARMTFSIIPLSNTSLYQLKLAVDYPHVAEKLSDIDPLNYLNVDHLERSEYFSTGFYPLNSLFQVVIISEDKMEITDVKGNILETKEAQGEKIPTDIKEAGWVFSSSKGHTIDGKYLFGQNDEVTSNELMFSIAGASEAGKETNGQTNQQTELIVIAAIVVVAVAAAAYYLRGYKK